MSNRRTIHLAKSPLIDEEGLKDALAQYRSGFALPRVFYKDQSIFQHDMRKFVMNHWHCAGHASMVKQPGDYFTIEIAGESILIVRGDDMQIRALLNVCRHRGSRVCVEKEGKAKNGNFVCPYHAWTYDCSGDLQRARVTPEDFDKSQYNLFEITSRVMEGLIFITYAEKPLGFKHVEHVLGTAGKIYGWEKSKVAARRLYMIDANWKLVEENYQECYHCGPAHQEYSKRHVFSRPQAQRVAPDAAMAERDKALGIPLEDIDLYANDQVEEGQESADCTRSALFDGYQTGSRDGKPVAPLMGEFKGRGYDGGFSFIDFGPTSNFVAYPDYGLIYRTIPLSVDKTAFELTWLVDESAVEGKDYDVDTLIWMWDYTSQEDKKIIELNQQGVNSAFFQPGPYTSMEEDAQRYIEWYIAAMRS